MKCTCCLCRWRVMGEGAISQSSPSKALRMFCQSRFSFLLLQKFAVTPPKPTHTHRPTHPLPPSLPPVWIRLSLCACHGLAVVIVCWTGWTGCPHVSCQAHSTARPPETLQNCLCFWFTSQIKTAAADWQKKKKSSPRFLVFPWSLPQFSQPDFCMEKELASYPVIVAFWLLPPSEHCLSQNSFLLPDTKEIFGESSHPLQKIHKSKKKKKKGKKRNG